MLPAYLYGIEDACKVGVNDSLPLLRLHAHDECVLGDACVIHQHIHCAPRVHSFLEQPASQGTLSLCKPAWMVC